MEFEQGLDKRAREGATAGLELEKREPLTGVFRNKVGRGGKDQI